MTGNQYVNRGVALGAIADQATNSCDLERLLRQYREEHEKWVNKGLLAGLDYGVIQAIHPNALDSYHNRMIDKAKKFYKLPPGNISANPWDKHLTQVCAAHEFVLENNPPPSQEEVLEDRCLPGAVIISSARPENQAALKELFSNHHQSSNGYDFSEIAKAIQNGLPEVTLAKARNALTDENGRFLMPQNGKETGGVARVFLEAVAKLDNVPETVRQEQDKIANRIGFHFTRLAASVIKQALVLMLGGIVDTTMTPDLDGALPDGASWKEMQSLNVKHGVALVVGYSFRGPGENATLFERSAHDSIRKFQPLVMEQAEVVLVIDMDRYNDDGTIIVLAQSKQGSDYFKCSSLRYINDITMARKELEDYQIQATIDLTELCNLDDRDTERIKIQETKLRRLNDALLGFPEGEYCN